MCAADFFVLLKTYRDLMEQADVVEMMKRVCGLVSPPSALFVTEARGVIGVRRTSSGRFTSCNRRKTSNEDKALAVSLMRRFTAADSKGERRRSPRQRTSMTSALMSTGCSRLSLHGSLPRGQEPPRILTKRTKTRVTNFYRVHGLCAALNALV